MLTKIKKHSDSLTRPLAIIALFLVFIALLADGLFYTKPAQAAPSDHFVISWKTDNPGTSGPDTIEIPTVGGGYNYDIDWDNDGVFDQFGQVGNVSHTFGAPGSYTIRIKGNFPAIFFNTGSSYAAASIFPCFTAIAASRIEL